MSIKEGDMVSIRQDFINRYKDVQESIVKAMDKAGNEIAESDCIIVSRIKDPELKPPINDESQKGQKGTAVKTGDALSAGKILFYLILAIAALGCIAMCMIVEQKSAQAKRRHRRKRR